MKTIYKDNNIKFILLKSTDKSLMDFMEIRTNIWSRPGWAGPQETCEEDGYDESETEYFAVLQDTQVLGGCRLIKKSSGKNLPVAEYGEVSLQSATEISRWCIDPKVEKKTKTTAHKVMMLGMLKYLESEHIDLSYMDVCTFLFKFLKRAGAHLTFIGEEHSRPDGSTFIPAALDVRATVASCTLSQ